MSLPSKGRRPGSALVSEAPSRQTSGFSARTATRIVQRYRRHGPPRLEAAMPAHAVCMVIGSVANAQAVLHASSPPGATVLAITSAPERCRWHAHAMIMFDDLQHGCERKRRCSLSTMHGPRPSLSAARRSTRTSASLSDCPAGGAGASAALGAAPTPSCRAVELSRLASQSSFREKEKSTSGAPP